MASETLPSQLLAAATRASGIRGMEGYLLPDPIAQDIMGDRGFRRLDQELAAMGIHTRGVIGAGASSIVLDAGDTVVRLGRGPLTEVPLADGLLQPLHTAQVDGIRVQIMPKASTAGITEIDVQRLEAQLTSQGFRFGDAGIDNVGRVGGELVVIDPGAVQRVQLDATKTAINAYSAGRSGHALQADTRSNEISPKSASMRR